MLYRHAAVSGLVLSVILAQTALAGPAHEWRATATHTLDNNRVATSELREKLLENRKAYMHGVILDAVDLETGKSIGHTDTPRMELIAEDGVSVEKKQLEWKSSETPQMKVTNLGANGLLRGTLLLPVSGHTGTANARRWATSDVYHVTFTAADGKQTPISQGEKSLDIVTFKDVELPLTIGANKINYYRGGSGGVGGYTDGRTIIIVWDGK